MATTTTHESTAALAALLADKVREAVAQGATEEQAIAAVRALWLAQAEGDVRQPGTVIWSLVRVARCQGEWALNRAVRGGVTVTRITHRDAEPALAEATRIIGRQVEWKITPAGSFKAVETVR